MTFWIASPAVTWTWLWGRIAAASNTLRPFPSLTVRGYCGARLRILWRSASPLNGLICATFTSFPAGRDHERSVAQMRLNAPEGSRDPSCGRGGQRLHCPGYCGPGARGDVGARVHLRHGSTLGSGHAAGQRSGSDTPGLHLPVHGASSASGGGGVCRGFSRSGSSSGKLMKLGGRGLHGQLRDNLSRP